MYTGPSFARLPHDWACLPRYIWLSLDVYSLEIHPAPSNRAHVARLIAYLSLRCAAKWTSSATSRAGHSPPSSYPTAANDFEVTSARTPRLGSSNTGSLMESLPDEVLLAISGHLSENCHLRQLSRVSPKLRHIAQEILVKHARIPRNGIGKLVKL